MSDLSHVPRLRALVETLPRDESFATRLAAMSPTDRDAVLSQFSDDTIARLLDTWEFWARPTQLEPAGDWRTWLIKSGRGGGKNWTGSQWVKRRVESGEGRRIGLVARTAADYRDVVVQGDSGIIAAYKRQDPPIWYPSKRELVWSNGAVAKCYSSEKPDQARGPQHDTLLCDEFASWKYLDEMWMNLRMGLRLGTNPRACLITTPRPIQLLRDMINDPDVHVTTYHTFDNSANLAASFLAEMKKSFAGTSKGRQELEGEILDEAEGALWRRAWFRHVDTAPSLHTTIVAVDPSTSETGSGNEAGIIVMGASNDGHSIHGGPYAYVLADRSVRGSPETWARQVVNAYHEFGANLIVAEKNQGGGMVRTTLRTIDPNVPIELVHASKGKRTRAEPVSMLTEQGRIYLVQDEFRELVDQCCNWIPSEGDSPDRLDAFVWGVTKLIMNTQIFGHFVPSLAGKRPSRHRY